MHSAVACDVVIKAPKAASAAECKTLEQLPNIGPAIAADLRNVSNAKLLHLLVIWVLACSRSSGHSLCATKAVAGSWTISASTLLAITRRSSASSFSSSFSNTSVFSVRYSLAPAR